MRFQHELTKTNFNGLLLDPSIPAPPQGALIADVATGTGTWALDVANHNPDVHIEGLDVNLNEVPPKCWLPNNITFKHFNLLETLPKEFEERYDIVHLQYVMIFVHDPDFPAVLQQLIAMLKPGGWLQWTDSDNNNWTWTTATRNRSPTETVKLHGLYRALFTQVPTRTWLSNLRSSFVKAGLDDVRWTKGGPQISTLQPAQMNWLWSIEESRGVIEKRFPERMYAIEQCFEQRQKALMEADADKVGLDMCMIRCIGRKAPDC